MVTILNPKKPNKDIIQKELLNEIKHSDLSYNIGLEFKDSEIKIEIYKFDKENVEKIWSNLEELIQNVLDNNEYKLTTSSRKDGTLKYFNN